MTSTPEYSGYSNAGKKAGAVNTLKRRLVVILLMLLPVGIGAVHLLIYPLHLPYFRGSEQLKKPPEATGEPATQLSKTKAEQLVVDAQLLRIKHTFSVVLVSCMIVSFVLGWIDVSRSFLKAVIMATITTAAYILYDGQGAFLGPIVFALFLFWPLIGLGKLAHFGVTRD